MIETSMHLPRTMRKEVIAYWAQVATKFILQVGISEPSLGSYVQGPRSCIHYIERLQVY